MPDHPVITDRAFALSIRFLCRSVCVRFDDDIHIRSDFETSILAFLVSDNVLDANLPIQLVSFLNTDLCFLWFAWKGGLDHLLYLATHLPLPLAHGEPPA